MIDPVSASGGAWALTSAQRPQPPRMDMQAALAPVAETLGLSVEELQSRVGAGESLAQIAADAGVASGDLVAAVAEGLADAAPEGAPALSAERLTGMATRIVEGGGPGGPGLPGGPPPGGAAGVGATAEDGLDRVAGALGLDAETLLARLGDGESLSSIAGSQGVDSGRVLDLLVTGLTVDRTA